jgi:hypothetical protein
VQSLQEIVCRDTGTMSFIASNLYTKYKPIDIIIGFQHSGFNIAEQFYETIFKY